MAEETKGKSEMDLSSTKEPQAKKESSKTLSPPPPPPEKPLPGDCCGSGCVRCVWDVYYDELEDYNNLYATDSNPK